MRTANLVKRIETNQLAEISSSGAPGHERHEDRVAELFTKYYVKLVKSLVAHTRSWDEARDIASQAFLEILSQRPGTVNFLSAYLYRTAKNLAINRLTHEAMRHEKRFIVGYEPESRFLPESQWAGVEHATELRRAVLHSRRGFEWRLYCGFGTS